MAHLINQLKAETENISVTVQADGNKVEMAIKPGEYTTTYLLLDDITNMVDLSEQLSDLCNTLVNELNVKE